MATKKKKTSSSNCEHERTMSPFQYIEHLVRSGKSTAEILNYARAMSRAAIEIDEDLGYLPSIHHEAIAAIWSLTLALRAADAEIETLRKRLSRSPKPAAKKPAGELMKKSGNMAATHAATNSPVIFAQPSE